MIRKIKHIFVTAAAIALLPSGAAIAGQPQGSPDSDLVAAQKKFVDAIAESVRIVTTHPFYKDPENQAAGLAFLNAMTFRVIEENIILDRDFPYFSVMDFRSREGGDNPDQRYLYAPIRGGKSYRIWGRMGKNQVGMEFQIYKGYPWVPGNGDRSVATLSTADLKVAPDGTFEVILSPSRKGENWLESAADADRVMLRQTYSKWTDAAPGEVHIDPLGEEGSLKPRLTSAEMVRRLNLAADNLAKKAAPGYPDFVLNNYLTGPANTLPATPHSAVAGGGPQGRYYSIGHFDLQPDEALLIKQWPLDCYYQGTQLTDLWWSSIEYANRQSSLSRDQSFLSSDGAYYYVLSAKDPAIQNWLDTDGFRRGVLLIRMDCPNLTAIPKGKEPTARLVKMSEIEKFLPAGTPKISAADRKAEISKRRKAIQIRSGL